MNRTTQDVVQAGKKAGKGSHTNWNLPENFYTLKNQAILHIRSKAKDNDENTGIIPASTTRIPRTTLQQAYRSSKENKRKHLQ